MITVNVFTSKGRVAFAQKTFSTKKLAYSTFTVPKVMALGDKLTIPVTITNNKETEITYTVTFI